MTSNSPEQIARRCAEIIAREFGMTPYDLRLTFFRDDLNGAPWTLDAGAGTGPQQFALRDHGLNPGPVHNPSKG